ncbi:hypothetical protein LWI29_007740 [Acer saccharum]|uniref:Uncharacterized protein n=1 Tax=Acer saccharum TaxID=4024 RepID=A0AA39SCL6_ACESA|nr:hypothetical protein LWI29_007740 [Acer saccharum]
MQTDEIKSNSLSLQYPSGQTTCNIEFPILLSDLMTRKVYICESFSCFNLYVADRSLLLCPRCQRNIVNKMCNVSISSAKTNLRNEVVLVMGPKTLSKVNTQTTLFLLSLATVAFFRRPSQLFLHLWSSSIRETLKTYMETSQVNLKLLIDTKSKKVLFAEAGKDFVDFLFYLLSLPVATVTKLLKEKGNVGCLTDLYKSLENLNQTYMQPNQNKTSLLNPKSPLNANGLPLLLSDDHGQTTAGNRGMFYACSNNTHVSDVVNTRCPCGHRITKALTFVSSATAANSSTTAGTTTEEGGFVRGMVTYMVMDNLEVKLMSTISAITLLNELNVKDVGSLKEKIVVLGVDEGLELLKASLECKNALTSVFLSKIEVE